ncbi:fimbrillin family protein [Parabacteroides sp. OttesenSCG-928-G07]|nr:fimbrillin family protein [Parabacteroides sp. OttesenSCG-928-G07]
MKQIYSLLLFTLVLFACSQEEIILNQPDITGEKTIHFAASLTEQIQTRAETVNLPDDEDIIVIAPGYGSNAPNQKVVYEVINPDPNPGSKPSRLKTIDPDTVMKRSAKEMYFTAWVASEGVVIDEAGVGMVDFTADLNHFIGAHFKEKAPTRDTIDLAFKHLVAKIKVIVYNIATDENKNNPIGTTETQEVSITFPAIKQFGTVAATLKGQPTVTAGRTGESLKKIFGDEEEAFAEFYLPPLSSQDLLMYGSFTIKVGETTYVGTLNNLAFMNEASEIEAGQHITIEVLINDDHTALLQAVTLAPWTEYPTNLYNRPIPGIWGMEDLVLLSELVNEGVLIDWERQYKAREGKYYFFDENSNSYGDVIRLYTNISLAEAEKFLPIGTEEHPFTSTFDGNGYLISGLTLENSEIGNQGLFGVVKDATLLRVKVNHSTITGQDNVGILAGKITGQTLIDQCSASGGTVSGTDNVGGLVGYIDREARIYNSWISLNTVSGANNIGGLTGNNTGMVGNSYARLSRGIACTESGGGGFVGRNDGVIENGYSQAYFIQRAAACGAWVGINETGSTNDGCYWNSECIDNKYCYRIIGNNEERYENGLENYTSLLRGRRFRDSSGYLLNDNDDHSTYLRTELNNHREKSENKEAYQYWAVISGNTLPVLSNNNFKSE